MNSLQNLDADAINALHRAFVALSLDMSEFTFGALGIRAERSEAFRQLLRGELERFWSSAAGPEQEAQMVHEVLDQLDSILGPRAARELKSNLTESFVALEDDPQMFLWEQVVNHASRTEVPNDAGQVPALVKRLRWAEDPAVKQEGKPRASRIPHTDYDCRVVKRYDYKLDPLPGDLSPVTSLELAADRAVFLHAMRKALREGSDPEADLQGLLDWGKLACDEIGMPSEMLEPPRFLLNAPE